MSENKRKQAPGGGPQGNAKKSKRGNEGKWQTPHQRKMISHRIDIGGTIESGDAGIWVTCQRGLEKKAISEMILLCDELGEALYDIKAPHQPEEKGDDQDDKDIASSIEDEIKLMKKGKTSKADYTFIPVRSGIECVFFMKTRSPVEPVEFVNRICDDAERCTDMTERKLRHINRLTPVVLIGKSLDSGIERVAREVLSSTFALNPEKGVGSTSETEEGTDVPAHSYAIRPNIRASSLKRDEVINRVAALVGAKHKVNLTSPDKIILIDIYKNLCGMSVVDGPRWEALKKYNVNEIYKQALAKRSDRPPETKSDASVPPAAQAEVEAAG